MNGRINPYRSGTLRLKAATVRLESQPYNFNAPTRTPRLSSSAGIFWCQLTSSIAAASGTWGSLTIPTLTGQTVYQVLGGAQVALPGTYTVTNSWPVGWSAGKTTSLINNADGTFSIDNQAC